MYKKEITYEDLDGNQVTDTFLFYLPKNEITDLNFKYDGDLAKYMNAIVEKKDTEKMYEFIKDLVLMAYGTKSEDSKRFIKVVDGHRLADDFYSSPAFSELIEEFFATPEKIEEFINGCLPKAVLKEIEEAKKQNGGVLPATNTPIQ